MTELESHAPRASKTIDEVAVGDRIDVHYVITDDDLRKFAELSGDYNPVHFDDEYASRSIFGQRIAHGLISLAKFSGIFGMDLPGLGTLWDSQEVKFLAPVFLDTPYTAVALVHSVESKRVFVDTWVEDAQGNRVIEGRGCVIPITERQRKRVADWIISA
ncbi:MaoC family dehydratase [Devosia lacusdianchii]|uniref:MaoC family dehydratase n=1 Tax=Devosia lacusdianchii TaxID=2917991 RepID=UPI001F06FFB9|nr:MaoC family dehydratase [Devosia sp. JXJ CY 41]